MYQLSQTFFVYGSTTLTNFRKGKERTFTMKRKNLLLSFASLALLFGVGLAACSGNNPSGETSSQEGSNPPADQKIAITAADGKTTLKLGETVQLSSDVADVTWTSKKESVVTVSATGLVTAVGEGSTQITASKEGYKDGSIAIKVELEKITITAAGGKTTLVQEETVQLTADKDGVSWKSSDDKVASVDTTGKVTAIAPGSATITASKENHKNGTLSITVTRPAALATLHWEDADHTAADGWWGTAAEGSTPIYARSSGNASDSQCIAHFGNGDKEVLSFTSNASMDAELVITMACSSSIEDMSAVMDVTFNKTAVAIAGKGFEGGSSSEFAEFSLGTLHLEKGENRLELAFKDASAYPYLDDLAFYGKGSVGITVKASTKETITVEVATLDAEIGKTAQINVTKPTDLTGVTFVSDKESVATVDATGKVTGVSMGSANITVIKDGMYSARVKVSVTEVLLEGEIRVEAEQADEIVSGNTNFMNLTDGAYTQIERAHSGGGYITGYRVEEGDTLTMTFTSPRAQTMTLSAIASPAYQAEGEFLFASSCTIKLNEAELTGISAEAKISAGDGGMGQPTEEAVLCDVNVVEGTNTLQVIFKGRAPSFDFFRLVPKGK